MRKKGKQIPARIEASERSLFRDAVGDTQPLASDDRHHHQLSAPKALLRPPPDEVESLQSQLLALAAIPPTGVEGNDMAYRRPGLQDSQMRKLRRGHFPREDELDLHGLTVEQARNELAEFLVRCRQRNLRCVRIIHGKGLRSGERGPVLKTQLAMWLQKYDAIQAYCAAQRNEGGSGAVYVLMHGRRPGAG